MVSHICTSNECISWGWRTSSSWKSGGPMDAFTLEVSNFFVIPFSGTVILTIDQLCNSTFQWHINQPSWRAYSRRGSHSGWWFAAWGCHIWCPDTAFLPVTSACGWRQSHQMRTAWAPPGQRQKYYCGDKQCTLYCIPKCLLAPIA